MGLPRFPSSSPPTGNGLPGCASGASFMLLATKTEGGHRELLAHLLGNLENLVLFFGVWEFPYPKLPAYLLPTML